MQYSATLLSDQYPNGRISGIIEAQPGTIIFKGSDLQTLRMPLGGADIRIGGAGNRYVFFNHIKVPGVTIYTDDKNILKSEFIRYESSVIPILSQIRRRKRIFYISISTIAGLLIAGVVALFVFKGRIVEHIAELVPPETERSIADEMLKSAIAGKTVIEDSSLNARLALITTPLVNALNDTSFRFSFTIVKDPTMNAFALPGGAVVIHSELLEKADNAEEVAGVLAHEISHVSRRHHLRGIIGNFGIFFIIKALIGDVAGLSGDIATAGATLSSLKYGRDFETEADESGFALLNKAHISTGGMISFFEKLKKESGEAAEMISFLSTHPATSERIEHLKKLPVPSENTIRILPEYDQFRKDLKAYLNKDKNGN